MNNLIIKTSVNSILIFTISLFGIGIAYTQAAAPKETPALVEKAKVTYKNVCEMCHGVLGDGEGPAGKALVPKPRNFMTDNFTGAEGKKGADGKGKLTNPTKDQIYEVIKSGVKGTIMMGYGHLSEDEKWGLSYYILQMRKAKK